MEAPPEQQGSVTVEHLLRFLGRRELRHFHAALMELIGQYEQRISELTTHYQAEREVKEAQAAFLKSLQGVAAGRHATLREVAEKLNTYTQEVPKGIEDDIEICLRKVRCLAIGIDHAERDNIRSELEEYVLQLQARLPVLS